MLAAWKSISDDTPLSKRSLARRTDSSRVTIVWRVISSSSSSAISVIQPVATEAIRLICAALRVSSVARYCDSAWSFSARMRPKKSSSQAVKPKLTLYCDDTLPTLLSNAWKLFGLEREPLPVRPSAGNSAERSIWNCARACSMLSTDTRRSRLFARAVWIRPARRGSVKKSCHGRAAAAWPAGCDGSPGKVVGTGAAGRS